MKSKKSKNKIVYYDDVLNDDFAGTNIHTKKIDETFKFLPKNPFWRICSFMLYYFIAIPIVFVYVLLICGFRIKNKYNINDKNDQSRHTENEYDILGKKHKKQNKILNKISEKIETPGIIACIQRYRRLRGSGCFMYINHTHFTDAFIPAIVAFPKRAFVITGPDAVSIPAVKHIAHMLGCIPIPEGSVNAMNRFMEAVRQRAAAGYCVGIFPEAHIWPYCSFIRPFKDTSFRYPAMWSKPAVSVCVTYQAHTGLLSFIRKPRRTIYVSAPFYIEADKNIKENRAAMRERAYDFMCKMSEEYSTYTYVEYVERNESGEICEAPE